MVDEYTHNIPRNEYKTLSNTDTQDEPTDYIDCVFEVSRACWGILRLLVLTNIGVYN